MNLLPKSSKEFSSKQYWNEFFSKRGDKSFEWYGEYVELCTLLSKYIKISDNILVAGCGSSAISGDLYKVGFRQITNVDISEVVIRQMKERYGEESPNMKWVRGDLLNLPFESGEFSCILDKGTLDALMSDMNNEEYSKAEQYFKELDRILRLGGRFICISLLQEHILAHLLSWFPQQRWMMRFCRCIEAERTQMESGSFTHPVFMVICTKLNLNKNSDPIIEMNLQESSIQRLSAFDVQKTVEGLQQFAVLRHNLQNKLISDSEMNLELVDSNSGNLRYNLFVIDAPKSSSQLPFAVFIVPHGRETEWLFKTNEGQVQLADSASANRLIVVHLMRDQQYGSMQDVQDELSAKVLELAPQKLPKKYKIPFLSVGDDLGERTVLLRGHSDLSGDFLVEEVKGSDDQYLRRLIFLSNRNLVQSEAKLIHGRGKQKTGSRPSKIDHSYLACSHHGVMVASLQLIPQTSKVLLIGLGGGALANFIHNYFEKVHLVAVDIDEKIVEVAENWFEFKPDNRLDCHIADGIDFIEKQEKCGAKFDCIMFDVDSKEVSEGLSCPPKQFMEHSFLTRVSHCLTDKSIFVLNLACRDKNLKETLIKDLKKVFSSISSVAIPEEINLVLFCKNSSNCATSQKDFEQCIRSINKRLKPKNFNKNVFDLNEMFSKFEIL